MPLPDLDAEALACFVFGPGKEAQLVLGADLDHAGWIGVAAPTRRSRVAINQHTALKVPHHGSAPDLSVHLLQKTTPPSSRVWTVTPFARERLPRFDETGGVRQMLKHEAEIHLTSLPRRIDRQGGAPGLRVRCVELETLAEGFVPDPPRPGFPDCFVVTIVDAAGCTRTHHGDCSMVVEG